MTAYRVLVIVVVVALLVGLSGCVAPPKGNPNVSGSPGGTKGGTSGGSTGGVRTTTVPTTAPAVTGFITPATPFPVETPERPASNYTVLPDYTVNATPFVAIYYDTIAFKQNRTAFSYNLTMPPLVIDMCLSPNLTTRTIWYDSKYDDKDAVTKKVTAIGPSVWFEVTVRDPATGTVIAKDGFAKSYSVDTAKRLTIRNPGSYLIEFAGNEISAEIQVRVPKTGDQAGAALRNLSCSQPLFP